MAREEVLVLLRERLRGASNSGLVVFVGYLELGCFSKHGLGLGFLGLGLGMSTMSLMLWTLFLQLALCIRILGFG